MIKWNPDIPGEIPALPEGTKVLVTMRNGDKSTIPFEYTEWDWRQDLGDCSIASYTVVN